MRPEKKGGKMNLKGPVFAVIAVLLFSHCAWAAALTAEEAVYFYNEGVREQKAGNYEKAQSGYNKALMLDPYNADWKKYIANNRGVMYMQLQNMEAAEQAFNEALKIDPNYEPAKMNLGFIYEKRRSELESIKYWLKVKNINLDEMKPKALITEGEKKK
jgi:tetratricopeptide (TPR) repeat protein